MDLDDLLEDLLSDAAKAARRGVRQAVGSTRPARRKVRRVVRATAVMSAVFLLSVGVALAAIGDPGAIQTFFAALFLLGGAGSAATAGVATWLDRRDPDVRRERATAKGQLSPEVLDDDLRELPRDVREEFRRMLQARRLVQDLAVDGWVDRAALMELDGEIARLHRLLVADHRTSSLGGRASGPLRQQTSELADLLVALADEAVTQQVEDLTDRRGAAVTLTDARDHLVALREARETVREIDQQQRPAGA